MTQTQNHGDRHYIGGGNIGGMLGLSPYKTPLDEYQTIMGLAEAPDAEKLRFFKRRKAFEPLAAEIFEEETGKRIVRMNHRYGHAQHDFIRAEIDAETGDSINVEIKTVHPYAAKAWGESGSDDLPEYVAAQALHGLAVTGRDLAYVLALIGLDDVRIYPVARDDDACEALVKFECDFWERYVLPKIPPDPTSLADMAKRWPRDTGATVTASQEIEIYCRELAELKANIKTLEGKKAKCEAAIKAQLGEAATLIDLQGKTLATWKTSTSKQLDTKALRSAHPQLADAFSNETTMRRFLLKQ
jgi:putative phage-type endonuclease